jgi:hypothetical protein
MQLKIYVDSNLSYHVVGYSKIATNWFVLNFAHIIIYIHTYVVCKVV